jgi:hypothetical protein
MGRKMDANLDKEFQRINELVDRVFKSDKDTLWRKRQISALDGAEEAFRDWVGRSHSPQQAEVERSAFLAGWRAAMEQQ